MIEELSVKMQYSYCYTDKEYEGQATMNCYSGSVDYLSEMFIECPYYTPID